MRDLVLVVPSRGRPGSIADLRDWLNRTCKEDTSLLVGLDSDDPRRPEYPKGIDYVVRSGIRSVVPWMNELALPLVDEFRYIGMIGDDNRPRTTGWDTRIIEALQDKPFAFGNDLYPRDPGSHCAHIFCRSEIVKTLGYLGPPTLKHMFVDNVWLEWGRACGIAYLDDVIIEHLHFTTGKSAYDETYRTSAGLWDRDNAAWSAYVNDSLAADIEKIKGTCG